MARNNNATEIIMKLVTIKPSISSIPPRSIDNLHWSVIVNLHHSFNNWFSCERFCHKNIYPEIQHPILPILINDSIQQPINRLTKWVTSARDMLTSIPSWWVDSTTNDIRWNWYKFNISSGIIFFLVLLQLMVWEFFQPTQALYSCGNWLRMLDHFHQLCCLFHKIKCLLACFWNCELLVVKNCFWLTK